ncbi:MAG: hypothetical protein QOH46_1582, partial [Solirubrobacteraceae bacterium]|nr:hypothetical protein [Solirubrobacteraceae bacterium]
MPTSPHTLAATAPTGHEHVAERRARAVLDAVHDGIVVIDSELRVIEVNRRFCEMSGYAEHEWLSATAPYPIWPEEDAERLGCLLVEALTSGHGRHELTLRRRDGERFPAVVDVCPVEIGVHDPTGILCVVRDATDQGRERLELIESRERLQEAQEVARLSSWEWDPATDTFTVSAGLSESFGLAIGAPVPRGRLLRLVAPRDRRRFTDELDALLQDGRELASRHAIRRPGGDIAYVETRARGYRDAHGRRVVRGTTQDVGEQRRAEVEAAGARDFLQGTLDSLSAQIAVLGRSGEVVATNVAWDGSTGDAGVTAALGESYLAGWDAADETDPRAAAVARGLRAVLRGLRECFEFEYESSAGHWYLVRVTRYRGHGGTRVVVQRDDVTDRHRVQEASRLQARLLDEVDAAVVATDLDGRVTHWNDAAERLFGWSRNETIGRFVQEFVGPLYADTAAALAAAAAALVPWEGEHEMRRKDGTAIPVDRRITPIEDEHGTPVGIIGVLVDTSDRVRHAAELRSARDHLRAVTDSMGEGLYTVDDGGRLTYMNAAAEELLGWTAAELCGQRMHGVIHARHADGSPYAEGDCPVLSARTAGREVRVDDDVFVRKDGGELPVSYTAAPFVSDTGIRGAVVVFRDASEARAQQAKLERNLEALTWIERIREALDSDRFVLHAQPIIELASGATVQHELLIRMHDED